MSTDRLTGILAMNAVYWLLIAWQLPELVAPGSTLWVLWRLVMEVLGG